MAFLRKNRVTVAVISDTHIGSTLSLCPEDFKLDEGQKINISKAQRWLLDCWNDFWKKAVELDNKDIYTFILGDSFDNNHHGTSQLWSLNEADWKKAALEIFEPILRLSKHTFTIRGTIAHSKSGGSLDEELALMLNSVKHNDNASSWKRRIYVEDVLFDISHKGPIGRLPWTTGNALNRLSSEIAIECIRRKIEIPNVVLRSHNHRFATSSDDCLVKVISSPAWQLCTEYIYSINPSGRSDIGGLLFECFSGQYVFHKVIYEPEEEKPWKE